jgi:uncharacterized membrane protein YdjX (TVP38/TMEM64 family)
MNSETWSQGNSTRIIKAVAALLLVIAATILALTLNTQELQGFLQRYKTWSIAVSLGIYTLLGATPVPSEPLTLIITSMYGPWLAALLATLGNTGAALIEFFIGGRISDLSDFEEKKKKLPFHLGELRFDSPAFLLLGRMLPGFGPKFVSVVAGIYQVPIWTYLWTALVSNSVGAALVAGGGYGIFQLLLPRK